MISGHFGGLFFGEGTSSTIDIAETNNFTTYFDSIPGQIDLAKQSLQNIFDVRTKESIRNSLNTISKTNQNLVTIQYEVLKVANKLGLVDSKTKLQKVSEILKQAYAQEMDYSKVSQICSIIQQEPELNNLTAASLRKLSDNSPFFMLSLTCYNKLNDDMRDFLKEKILNSKDSDQQTMALMTMKTHWNDSDKDWLLVAVGTRDANLRTRIYMSAQKYLAEFKNYLLQGSDLSRCLLQSENKGRFDLG